MHRNRLRFLVRYFDTDGSAAGYRRNDTDAQSCKVQGYIVFQSFDFCNTYTFGRNNLIKCNGRTNGHTNTFDGDSVVVQRFCNTFLVLVLFFHVNVVLVLLDFSQQFYWRELVAREFGCWVKRFFFNFVGFFDFVDSNGHFDVVRVSVFRLRLLFRFRLFNGYIRHLRFVEMDGRSDVLFRFRCIAVRVVLVEGNYDFRRFLGFFFRNNNSRSLFLLFFGFFCSFLLFSFTTGLLMFLLADNETAHSLEYFLQCIEAESCKNNQQ